MCTGYACRLCNHLRTSNVKGWIIRITFKRCIDLISYRNCMDKPCINWRKLNAIDKIKQDPTSCWPGHMSGVMGKIYSIWDDLVPERCWKIYQHSNSRRFQKKPIVRCLFRVVSQGFDHVHWIHIFKLDIHPYLWTINNLIKGTPKYSWIMELLWCLPSYMALHLIICMCNDIEIHVAYMYLSVVQNNARW